MGSSEINTGGAISYGWNSVKSNFWYFIAVALIVGIVSSISSRDQDFEFLDLIGYLLSILMVCGSTTLYLGFYDGKKLPLTVLFTSTKQYLSVLLGSILYGLGVFVGLVLLIIPGIYFALTYQFVVTLIIDKNMGIGEAFKASAAMTKGKKMSLLGFNITLLGVVLLGALALIVGVLVAVPVVTLATTDVYRRLSGGGPVTPSVAPAPAV